MSRQGFLARLFGPRYRHVPEYSELAAGDVLITGAAEAVEHLEHPFVPGQRVLAIEYRAWPPSTTVGMDGATAHGSRAFEVRAHQAVAFGLADTSTRVLVRVPHGDDVARLHAELVARYGVGLRTEVHTIPDGACVAVEGRVRSRHRSGSPHRAEPYAVVLDAHRFWPV